VDTFANSDRDLLGREALLNAVAVLRLTHAAVTAMCKQGRGNVINVSAGCGVLPDTLGHLRRKQSLRQQLRRSCKP
jgi:short-subunit dehydrogenase